MRILHVLDHSIPLQSGYTFRTLAILREQRRLGWETFHLTSPKHAAPSAPEEEVDGLALLPDAAATRRRSTAFPVVRELALMRATARRLDEVARVVRPDILHAHSPVLNALPALRVGRRLGIPVVYEVRAFWEDAAVDHGTSREGGLRYRLTRALETYALRRADARHDDLRGPARRTSSRAAFPRTGSRSFPMRSTSTHSRSAGEPDAALKAQLGLDGTTVIGFIGSFYAYEGLDLLLDALPQVLARMPRRARAAGRRRPAGSRR